MLLELYVFVAMKNLKIDYLKDYFYFSFIFSIDVVSSSHH
jgi:hypothetical protein